MLKIELQSFAEKAVAEAVNAGVFLLLFMTLLFRIRAVRIKSETIYMVNSHELYLLENIYYLYILPT